MNDIIASLESDTTVGSLGFGGPGRVSMTNSQQVVMVDGSAEIMDEIETVLDAGNYDIVFVESTEHALCLPFIHPSPV